MFRIFFVLLLISGVQAVIVDNQKSTPVLILCAKNCGGCKLEQTGEQVDCDSAGFSDEDVVLRGELWEGNGGKDIKIVYALNLVCTKAENCENRRGFGRIPEGENFCFLATSTAAPSPVARQRQEDPFQNSNLLRKFGKNKHSMDPSIRQFRGACNVNSK